MQSLGSVFSIHFTPELPTPWLIALVLLAAVMLVISLLRARRLVAGRILVFALFALFLAGPSLVEEDREPIADVAAVILDTSISQSFGERKIEAQDSLNAVKEAFGDRDNLELRIIEAPKGDGPARETHLFQALDKALSDVPRSRRAGVILITDGQVHDVPEKIERQEQYGPVHVLLTGEKDERDRKVVIQKAPAYGIVGRTVTVAYSVEDEQAPSGAQTSIIIRHGNGTNEIRTIPLNTTQEIEFILEHAGQNVFEIEATEIDEELTAVNNKAAILVNGVRDRLRVLLVSGQPHAGGRTWRDLLKSDPSVELVHFTILREPDKLNTIPQNELSLIAFPFRELFEIKLYDFDLIIFDRYRLNNVVPDRYFANIATFVQNGGGLLVSSGPDYAGNRSLHSTSLAQVLPAIPTGEIDRQAYRPAVTDDGRRHPVTRSLVYEGQDPENWGQWLRQVRIVPNQEANILMQGYEDHPLLLLERVGQGRVAQFTSDHIWLWSRAYDGGGPHSELLKRVVHWLMKEPELDEQALNITVEGDVIRLRIADYGQLRERESYEVMMERPEGTEETIRLERQSEGWLSARISAEQLGVYSFEGEDGQRRYAVVGDLNPPELMDVKTTDNLLHPVSETTGGGVFWTADNGMPRLRLADTGGRPFAGASWLALRQNNAYSVNGVTTAPLFPEWLALLLLGGFVSFIWWREGRS